MFTKVALVATATTVAVANGQSAQCSAGDQILTSALGRTWCDDSTGTTNFLEFEACCSGNGESSSRRLLEIANGGRAVQEEECRIAEFEGKYCDESVTPGCTDLLGTNDVMTMEVSLTSQGDAGSCCETCTCFGDPECIAFDGTEDEWIVCDGRDETCSVTQKVCKKQIDHAGNKCVYLKNTPDWTSWEDNGSPCQANWTESGYPTMSMYATDDFNTELVLSERGIILEATITTGGNDYTLNAAECFNTIGGGWNRNDLPDGWSYTTRSNAKGTKIAEVWWSVSDVDLGIYMTIVCTNSLGSSVKRLNVQSLIETVPTRISSAQGFCATGAIGEKSGTTEGSHELHAACLRENLPDLLNACKALVDVQCRIFTVNEAIDTWCTNADIARISGATDVEDCKTILKTGTRTERTAAWTEFVCQANQLDVAQCTTEISQFGWATFLESYSNGMIVSDNTGGPSTCASSPSDYGLKEHDCQQGISVQYENDGGEWVEAFFIPADLPPCGDSLELDASEYRELFVNNVRFVQCDLNSECVLENQCAPAVGFTVGLNFVTDNCPTPTPTVSPTQSPTCETTIERGQLARRTDIYPTYEIEAEFELNAEECRSKSNVFQVGCTQNKMVSLNIEECSTDGEVLVYTESGEVLDCSLPNLGLYEEHALKVSGGDGTVTVTLDGSVACTFSYDGELRNGEDTCVLTSASDTRPANVCLYDLRETSEPFCQTNLEPDNLVRRTSLSREYTVDVGLAIDSVTCANTDSNVFQIGCESNYNVMFNLQKCSTTPEILVAIEGSDEPVVCTMTEELELHTDYVVTIEVGDGEVKAYIDNSNTPACTATYVGEPAVGNQLCVYQSAPDMPAAGVCLVDLTALSVESVCDCIEADNQMTICDGTTEPKVMGTCESCCPETTGFAEVGPECRELVMPEPYCDSDIQGSAKCNSLANNGGKLTLTFEVDSETELSCCKQCICYGDPECQAFDKSEDKWILCDARRADDCITDESICTSELDHAGNSCVWHPEIAEALTKRSDIGALGSPCLPDESSGKAWMTMYEVSTPSTFKAMISMGERGVIEELALTTGVGEYTLVADDCFNGDGLGAWVLGNNAAPLEEGLTLNIYAGPGAKERTVEILDPLTKIFVRAVCISQTSSDGSTTSYRMNINNLVETDNDRVGSGYCAVENAVIDSFDATREHTDAIYEKCNAGLDDAHLLCKALWEPSCTAAQVKTGVAAWCLTANVYPNNSNRVNKCIDFIGTSARKWEQLYCDAVSSLRDESMTANDWRKICVSRLQTEGYSPVVEEYSKGTLTSGGVEICGASTDAYAERKNECQPGVSVEYQGSNGEWNELFFIPSNLPPCMNTLEITAKKFPQMFTKPIRFRECEIDSLTCPVDVGCLPHYGYSISYLFTQEAQVCDERRVLRGD